MKPARHFRLAAALYALVSLLFMQFAGAAHACSVMEGKADRIAHVAAAVESADNGCQIPDQEPANLCKSHCERGAQSVDTGAQPSVQAPVLPLLVSLAIPDPHRAALNPRADAFFISIPEPPPALRFCVLRI